jgi:diguanylate cyclase (GGDEF)-like protein
MLAAVRQTATQAKIDFVTGLWNRAAWEEYRTLLAQRQLPACVVLLDLDNFKACNDSVNWSFGDVVLKAVADRIAQTMPTDIVARWGGDEFALLFLKTSADAVAPRLEQLRSAIAAIRLSEHPRVVLSASIGCAILPAKDHFDAAFAACQHALQEAKRRGGNCTIFAADSPSE